MPETGAPKPSSVPDADMRNPIRLGFRDWIYMLHIFGRRERAVLLLCLALALAGGSSAAALILFKYTIEAPKAGGILREGVLRSPKSINPLFISTNDTDRDLVALIYARLFHYDADGNLKPELADSYEVSEDGKSYTVSLRQDVRWHDGTPLTADDVRFTIQTIQDPAFRSSLRANWQGVTIERLGEFRVRFVLKQPYSPFLQNLVLAIVPQHIWGKFTPEEAFLSSFNQKPIGAGPYSFEKFILGENDEITEYDLIANKNYFDGSPFIQRIEFHVANNEDALVSAYRADEIDSIENVSMQNINELKNLGADIYAVRIPQIFAVFLNEANPILADKSLRQALAMAIPKDELIKQALGGGAVSIEAPIPPGTFGFAPNISPTPYDPERARQTLERLGWTDLNQDGLREKKPAKKGDKPTPLKITLATSERKDLVSAVNAIKEYWREIGVDAEVKTLPIGDLNATVIRPRAYDALLFGEILSRDPDPFAFWHSTQLKDPGLNIALYHSKQVDTLLEEARRLTDQNQIRERYEAFQKILDTDFPTIFLYSPTYYYAAKNSIRGINLKTLVLPSERFFSITEWFIKTMRVLPPKQN